MKTKCETVESFLSRHWRVLGVATCLLMVVSCAYSRFTPSGELETVGQDIIPGVTVGADVVGAVVDAAKDVPVGDALDAVSSGSWLNLAGIVIAFVGAAVGGVIARKKYRAKKAAQ